MDSPISHGLLAENTREPEISDTNENVFQTFETEIKSNDVGFSVYLRPFSFFLLTSEELLQWSLSEDRQGLYTSGNPYGSRLAYAQISYGLLVLLAIICYDSYCQSLSTLEHPVLKHLE